jgi:hypothetical protein
MNESPTILILLGALNVTSLVSGFFLARFFKQNDQRHDRSDSAIALLEKNGCIHCQVQYGRRANDVKNAE